MVCDKHAKEEFILSTTGRTTTTVYDRGRQPRPPWHCDANREDHMTELDHEVVKGLCDRMNTIYEIYKKNHVLTSEASYLFIFLEFEFFAPKLNVESLKISY